jgi:hypothetical protein
VEKRITAAHTPQPKEKPRRSGGWCPCPWGEGNPMLVSVLRSSPALTARGTSAASAVGIGGSASCHRGVMISSETGFGPYSIPHDCNAHARRGYHTDWIAIVARRRDTILP